MKYEGELELVYSGKKLVPVKRGYSLGVVYKLNPETNNNYQLFNFGYCPSTKEFYFNRNIKLPKKYIEYFERMEVNAENEMMMQKLEILPYSEIEMLLNQYEVLKNQQELAYQKILNFKKILKKDDK